ncbi:tyrosine-protein phosphatase required for protection against superoxide stress (By similarity) [Apiotrichum porosum]|uniref:Putative tyrosine-protein phosphatase OCA1 n=1 Tax=Apiotrichum porosum TaxID=105984 RepID=A0A427XHA3_9TREE|nr:tyrosine-protein phosphatase required for protection against superoxide stress (By similarity) [Apiotrichum porosum]RSH78275.1 tyrosine-protein phosphatase required for protection against superoxide stress (By similarity) [Apiotrichum porosum]
MAKIVPPMNFGLVEDELNFSFLEKLDLRTVIWVGAEEPTDVFISFLESQGIVLHNLAPQVSLNPHFPPRYCDSGVVPLSGQYHLPPLPPPTEPLIIHALTLLLQPSTFPTLRWALSSILEEYRRYAGMKVRVLNEQFIELFDTDLVSITAETPA